MIRVAAQSVVEIRMFDLCFVLMGFLIGLITCWVVMDDGCPDDWDVAELMDDPPGVSPVDSGQVTGR